MLIATLGAHLAFIRGELGDFLVVILLYAIAKAVRPALPALPLALAVFAIAAALETGQYFGLADALGLPRGSVWRIVVGTTFQWADLAMYALGCATAWLIDRKVS